MAAVDDADGGAQRSEQREQAVEGEAGTRDDPEETALQALELGWQGASLAREFSERGELVCRFMKLRVERESRAGACGFLLEKISDGALFGTGFGLRFWVSENAFQGYPPPPSVYCNHRVSGNSSKNLKGSIACGQNLDFMRLSPMP